MRLHVIFWNAVGPGSVAYTITELLDNFPEGVDKKLWCLRADKNRPREYHCAALPEIAFRLLCKAGVSATAQGRLARRFALRSVEPGDLVYVWPPYDLTMIKRAQDRGAVVIAERINCMGQMCRNVLSDALNRRGIALPDDWCLPDAITEERRQMAQCDFVTAPNALVSKSLSDAGIPASKILQTSYGYNPVRLSKAIGIDRPSRSPVFAFVGLGHIRKGLDVLLEAWELAGVDGKLLIAGRIEDDIRADYTNVLSRADVRELGFIDDIASVYAAADVFVFPTHEEGGPQVIYEAAACGLASIVSPMGTGRVVRHEQECLVIDPLKVDDLATAITKLAADKQLRLEFGTNAARRAKEFTWSKVAGRLYEQLRDHA